MWTIIGSTTALLKRDYLLGLLHKAPGRDKHRSHTSLSKAGPFARVVVSLKRSVNGVGMCAIFPAQVVIKKCLAAWKDDAWQNYCLYQDEGSVCKLGMSLGTAA